MTKKGHIDRNQNKENERQTKIEKHLDCKFFHRINPNIENFDIFLEVSKIKNEITHSDEEKLKNKFAEELLNYILNISKPLKHIRCFVEKYSQHYKKWLSMINIVLNQKKNQLF